MNIVAFLQNQWFYSKSLPSVQRVYAEHGEMPEGRAMVNALYLLFGCLTGRRLKTAFGEELCDRIIWENASPRIGTESCSKFPPDSAHILAILTHFRPEVIITFGKVADEGVRAVIASYTIPPFRKYVTGPHPAARHASVVADLARMAAEVREAVAACA